VTSTAFSQNEGIILVAHKSTKRAWNNQVLRLPDDIRALDSNIIQPIEVAFLDFRDSSEVNTLEWAIRTMVADHNKREILLVPIFASSYGMYNHIKVLTADIVQNLPSQLPTPTIVIAPAMDEDPHAVTMLRECAMNISGNNPADKALLLVSFGPFDEAANLCVLEQLRRIGSMISGFKTVDCFTLRPHEFPPNPTIDKNAQAVKELNETAQNLISNGASRVIVVPYVFQGDFHKVLRDYLKGVRSKRICNEEKIFHDETKAWIVEVINRGMSNQLPLPPPPPC
jgi:sirohydrochlorin ferrochelatase